MPSPAETRARDARELERQREWRQSATRALSAQEAAELMESADAPADETEAGERFGVSSKRLEQAVKELQLPVELVRDAEDADVVITLRNYFRQKAPALREAEERGLPIFVLKSNTMIQLESCLTSIFALDVDPRDAALREVEEAIGLVQQDAKPIELSPQSAFIRRLQHQAAERANLVTRSRGREPYRRVRVYPESSRAWR
jgi:hypothetical protein